MSQPGQVRRFVAPLAERATSSRADRCFALRGAGTRPEVSG
jgi:hypothetical protein